MKIQSDFHQHHMKTDISSERLWVTLENNEISNNLLYFGKHYWNVHNILLPHIHTVYEFIYVVGGEGSISVRGINCRLSPGDILVIEPNSVHEGVAHPENPIEFCFMGYDFNQNTIQSDPSMFVKERAFLRLFETYTNKMQLPVIHDHYHIGHVLFKVIDEVNDTQLYREELIKTYFQEIFILLLRDLSEAIDVNRPLTLDGKEPAEKAKEFIRTHFDEFMSVERIADHVYLSPAHFSRLFKKETKLTPMEYLTAIRIENAKKLLIYSDLTLTEISYRIGFSGIHYFSHCFKRKERISPLAYRRENKRLLSL